MMGDAVGQGAGQGGTQGRGAGRFGKLQRDIEIAVQAALAGGIDPQGGAGRQAADIVIEGMRLGHRAEQEKTDMARRIRTATNAPAGDQALDRRGGAQRPPVIGVIKRLDAERIAGQQQALPLVVPKGQGEHAPEPFGHGRAVAAIEVQQDLGVGLGVEAMALLFELAAQRPEVINLAIIGDVKAVQLHRLGGACVGVDDRQAPMRQAGPAARRQPFAGTVGSARRLGRVDRAKFGAVDGGRLVAVGE